MLLMCCCMLCAQVCVVASVTVCGGRAAQTERDPATTRDHDRGSSTTTTTTTASAEAARLALMTTIVCVCVCVFHMNTQNETCGSNTVCAHTGESNKRVLCCVYSCTLVLFSLRQRIAQAYQASRGDSSFIFMIASAQCRERARDGVLCVLLSVYVCVCVCLYITLCGMFFLLLYGESRQDDADFVPFVRHAHAQAM